MHRWKCALAVGMLGSALVTIAACSSSNEDETDQTEGAQTAGSRSICTGTLQNCSPFHKRPGCSTGTKLPGGGEIVFAGGACEIGSLCAVDNAREENGKANRWYGYNRCVPRAQVGVLGSDEQTCAIEGNTARFCGIVVK